MANIEAIKSAIVDKEEELKDKVRKEKIIERELNIGKVCEDVANVVKYARM
ncbi:MAG: hypothetical protein H5T50_08510 [Nitrososphaeria archaeon]|nr:hypothetical protein [Nitrososphaeria archaeon]